jgi:hypothetical protein
MERNDKFAHAALDTTDGHRALDISHERLDVTLSIQETRRLSKNLEAHYKTAIYQVQRPGTGYALRHAQVSVCEGMDGTITIRYILLALCTSTPPTANTFDREGQKQIQNHSTHQNSLPLSTNDLRNLTH